MCVPLIGVFFLFPRWTKEELKKVIAMLQNPEFDLWLRELEDVVQEIMEDPIFKGNQNFKFELDLDEAVKRLFGGEANAGVAFQIGQLRYIQ